MSILRCHRQLPGARTIWRLFTVACLGVGGTAYGQQAPVAPGNTTTAQTNGSQTESESPLTEVTVTGSRISRPDFESATPLVTVDAASLQDTSPVTVGDELKRYPQFSGSGTGGESSGGGIGTGQFGTSQINLRDLGTNRNLILLDGRRMEPTALNFAVDVNTIPADLIENVEIMTGGASAAYGSDAISGVVNFKLRHDFQGVETTARWGESYRGDYQTRALNILAGTNFADNRGNIVVSVGITNRSPSLERDIDFYRQGMAIGQGPLLFSFLGTGYFRPFGDTYNPAVAGQLVGAPGPLASGAGTIGFNSNNSLFTVGAPVYGYNSGVFPNNPKYAVGPSGVVYNGQYYLEATTPINRQDVFERSVYKVTDSTEFYTQAMYSHYSIAQQQYPTLNDNFWGANIPVDATHPVPAAFGALLASRTDPTAPWYLGRTADWAGPQQNQIENELMQITTGLNGSVPINDWTWDAYVTYGQTHVTSTGVANILSTTKINELLDAPNYGAGFTAGGTNVVCTSGISPFIPTSSVTRDCVNFASLYPTDVLNQQQTMAEGTVQGKIIALPAGSLRFAAGVDYRRNSFVSTIDSAFQLDTTYCSTCTQIGGDFARPNSRGAVDVWEGYGELLVPVLSDIPAVKSLDLDMGYRYSKYQLIGGTNTYSLDLNWKVVKSLSLRGGFQRAVRAPNPEELFSAPQVGLVATGDPCAASGPSFGGPQGNSPANPHQAQLQQLCAALTPGGTAAIFQNPNYIGNGTPFEAASVQGNPNLSPETANTYTVGAVFQPSGDLPLESAVSMSLDYYSIKVDGAIGSLNAQQIYDLCFNYNGTSNPTYSPTNPYCQPIIRSPAPYSIPANAQTFYENQGGIKTQGVDLQADWRLRVGPGRLNLDLQSTRLINFELSSLPGAPFVNYTGSVSSSDAYFKWRDLLTATYSLFGAQVGARATYLSSAKDVSCVLATKCAPGTSSYDLVDLFAGYKFGSYRFLRDIDLTAGVDNVANRQPPAVSGIHGNTNAGEYRVVGRSYWVTLRAQL